MHRKPCPILINGSDQIQIIKLLSPLPQIRPIDQICRHLFHQTPSNIRRCKQPQQHRHFTRTRAQLLPTQLKRRNHPPRRINFFRLLQIQRLIGNGQALLIIAQSQILI